ncbi:MAG: hypothetical protein R6V08_06290 [Desulfuromonadales bacterium]
MKPLPLLKHLSYPQLAVAALLLGLAPFSPEPHLTEKIRMLLDGRLTRGIDIFDLLFHSLPLVLLALKFLTEGTSSRT